MVIRSVVLSNSHTLIPSLGPTLMAYTKAGIMCLGGREGLVISLVVWGAEISGNNYPRMTV